MTIPYSNMGKIYLGSGSFFKLPNPTNKKLKAEINAVAQALDFADGDTVVKTKRGYEKAKFNYKKGKGKKNVSFKARLKIIEKYAPEDVQKFLKQIDRLARLYANGKITKREYTRRVKELAEGKLGKKLADKIIKKVMEKDRKV